MTGKKNERLVKIKYHPLGSRFYITMEVKESELKLVEELNKYNSSIYQKERYYRELLKAKGTIDFSLAEDMGLIDSGDAVSSVIVADDIKIKQELLNTLDSIISTLTPNQQSVISTLIQADFDISAAAQMKGMKHKIFYNAQHKVLKKIKSKFEEIYGKDFNFLYYIKLNL